MKVPYSWLKDYVDVKMEAEKLAYLLTMAGVNVASFAKQADDYIFEFEITANRADCLSIIGIAREVSAILGKKLELPKELKTAPRPKSEKAARLKINIETPELCFSYTARIIRNVAVKPSPDWLREKIISVGLRPVNNIVDITNFVLFETGQPMHAFDLDRIKGNLSVRRASRGEKIITIDNNQKECGADTLVIADESGPIAVAGVMGGIKSEVSDITKNILLESAFFEPVSIRKTSRLLGVTSESSYRFERRVDKAMVLKASERGASLIALLAGGEKGELISVGEKPQKPKIIKFDFEKSNFILGVQINKGKIAKIFNRLGFSVKSGKNYLNVSVPGFRADIKSDIDLTEEVARIYGYHHIPLTIPRIVGNTAIKDFEGRARDKLFSLSARLGLSEIITYSLIKRENIKSIVEDEKTIIAIKNPLSIDQEIMRPTLMSGMLGAISRNLNRKAKSLAFFEIGKIYKEENGSYVEEPVLSIGLAGVKEENWKKQREDFDFFDLKGLIEKILEGLKSDNIVFKKESIPGLDRNASSKIEYENETVGFIGEADRTVTKRFDIEKKVFYGELNLAKLSQNASPEKRYIPYTKYPSVERDISVVLDKDVSSEDITHAIREVGKKLVKNVALVDCYKGTQIPHGKRGLLYRIEYRSDEKTLEDKEVDALHSEIKDALSRKLNVVFR